MACAQVCFPQCSHNFFLSHNVWRCAGCYKQYQVLIGEEVDTVTKPPSGEGKASVLKASFVHHGVTIEVRHGDLTTETTFCIVNAANQGLGHASGLAGAIVKKGGRIIQDESNIWIAEQGRLKDGECAWTYAGFSITILRFHKDSQLQVPCLANAFCTPWDPHGA
jgi:hypothetical protein